MNDAFEMDKKLIKKECICMPIDLTPYIVPDFNFLLNVPDEVFSNIRHQSTAGEAQIQLGELMVSIRPMSVEGFFMGSID